MVNGNVVTEPGDAIIIKLIEPYKNVKQIISFTDETIGEDTSNYFSKWFRWSTDNQVFTDFIPLTDLNLQRLLLDPSNDFWIEYKYEAEELDTGNTLEFVSIALEIITETGRLQEVVQVCTSACDASDVNCVGNLMVEECCDDGNLFSPYTWAQQGNPLYNQLTQVTTQIFGHCVRYYRAEPDQRSEDVFLKEHTLFNRNQVKEIQVLVPGNEFPSNEFQFDPFIGMGHEGFEIHITRQEFEAAFGANQRPRERDSIYIPLNQKKYEVSSVALSNEIFQMHAYWRVKLKKWEDKANIMSSPEIEQELDDLVTNMEEAFDEEREKDFLKITKPQQYKTIGTGKYDYVRSELSTEISIAEEKINNNWTIVSKNFYSLNKLELGEVAVKYRKDVNIETTDNRAFTFWFRSRFLTSKPRILISAFSDNGLGFLQVTTTNQHDYEVNDIVEIYNSPDYGGTIHYVQEIIDSNNIVLTVEYVPGSVPSGSRIRKKRNAIALYGYNLSNPSADGMSIELLKGYINVSINNENYIFGTGLDEYEEDVWYSVVVNLSNQFKQLSAWLYKLDKQLTYSLPQAEDSTLTQVSYGTMSLDSEITVNSGDTWSLIGGPIELTNIRIFKETLEEENHDATLNQYVVRDTHLALLVDNAIPQIRLMRLEGNR